MSSLIFEDGAGYARIFTAFRLHVKIRLKYSEFGYSSKE
jgi:hypothetical protein